MAWTDSLENGEFAVTSFQLPGATAEATEQRLSVNARGRHASDPPLPVAAIIDRVCLHLGGDPQDFRDIPANLDGYPPFMQRVCMATRAIPAGQTITYADLARAIGQPSAVRAVARALGRNPIPLIIPCHRVVAAHGKPGGFSAYGGRATKAKLLALEGAVVNLCLELSSGT